jgi:hypothetical protein
LAAVIVSALALANSFALRGVRLHLRLRWPAAAVLLAVLVVAVAAAWWWTYDPNDLGGGWRLIVEEP